MLRSSERRSMCVEKVSRSFRRSIFAVFNSFQDEANVYLLLEFIDGGSTKFFGHRFSSSFFQKICFVISNVAKDFPMKKRDSTLDKFSWPSSIFTRVKSFIEI